MPAWYSADSEWRRCSPAVYSDAREHPTAMNLPARRRRRRSAASMQIVSSGAKMLSLEQTSSSSSSPRSKSRSSRSSFANARGISSAAANRSAGSGERTRRRCSSINSRIVNRFPSRSIQTEDKLWLVPRGNLTKDSWRVTLLKWPFLAAALYTPAGGNAC